MLKIKMMGTPGDAISQPAKITSPTRASVVESMKHEVVESYAGKLRPRSGINKIRR